jgi:GR25 family glycosyltransferase involved in LPS biosynthesis
MNYEVKVLSLKRRSDRREYITNLIGEKYPFTFFDAIDGNETEIVNDIFKNSDYHLWNVNPNSVKAVTLSNMQIWKECVDENKNICIFEDDIDLVNDIKLNLDELFKKDFDIHFLNNITQWFPNCYCYLIKPNGAQKLLNHFNVKGFTRSIDWEITSLGDPFKILYTEDNNFTKSSNPVISKSDIILGGNSYNRV